MPKGNSMEKGDPSKKLSWANVLGSKDDNGTPIATAIAKRNMKNAQIGFPIPFGEKYDQITMDQIAGGSRKTGRLSKPSLLPQSKAVVDGKKTDLMEPCQVSHAPIVVVDVQSTFVAVSH